jgi:hypothetical protein
MRNFEMPWGAVWTDSQDSSNSFVSSFRMGDFLRRGAHMPESDLVLELCRYVRRVVSMQ